MDEIQVGKKRRARRTGKDVQRLVKEFTSGGMKRSEFCRSRGLSLGTLRRHLEGGKQGARQTPRLVAVELEEKAVPKANAIEVVLGRGRGVEVRPGFDATTLQAVTPQNRLRPPWSHQRITTTPFSEKFWPRCLRVEYSFKTIGSSHEKFVLPPGAS
jgi:hypothetical protein